MVIADMRKTMYLCITAKSGCTLNIKQITIVDNFKKHDYIYNKV